MSFPEQMRLAIEAVDRSKALRAKIAAQLGSEIKDLEAETTLKVSALEAAVLLGLLDEKLEGL